MTNINSPIRSGWRGDINGFVNGTNAQVMVSGITLVLDTKTAHFLCSALTDYELNKNCAIDEEGAQALSELGAALGRMIDHPSANNGGRSVVK